MKDDDMMINSDILARKFGLMPNKKFAFFLGAGASASSNIPTAFEMTEDFKRRLYASEKGIKITTIEQRYYDFKKDIDNWIKIKFKDIPDNEYAFFFEKAFPSKKDRTEYIRKSLELARPSIGYEIIRFLIGKGIIWHFITTNFDNLIQKVYPDLIEITEENIKTHEHKININPEYPIAIKLHGDFRYDWLRNTDTETQILCSSVLESLKELFKYLGLIVIGYSGRDESVMSFIEKFTEEENKPFPHGFYWCIKEDGNYNPRIKTLIERLKEKGIEANFIKISSFDDLLIEIYKQLDENDDKIDEWLSDNRVLQPFRVSDRYDNNFIVLNCLRIIEYPQTFLTFKYKNIQNWEDLTALTEGKHIIASFFREKNIIALGDEGQIIETFKDYIEDEIGYYTITENDLNELNKQRGFIYGIYYEIFNWYFLNVLGLKRFNKKRVFYKEQIYEKELPRYSQKIRYFKAFNYSIEFRDKKLLFILTPYYITADFESIDIETYKIRQNLLISNIWNKEVLEDLIEWQRIFRNGREFIKIEFPSGTLRFLIQSKFYKCGKAL